MDQVYEDLDELQGRVQWLEKTVRALERGIMPKKHFEE